MQYSNICRTYYKIETTYISYRSDVHYQRGERRRGASTEQALKFGIEAKFLIFLFIVPSR